MLGSEKQPNREGWRVVLFVGVRLVRPLFCNLPVSEGLARLLATLFPAALIARRYGVV